MTVTRPNGRVLQNWFRWPIVLMFAFAAMTIGCRHTRSRSTNHSSNSSIYPGSLLDIEETLDTTVSLTGFDTPPPISPEDELEFTDLGLQDVIRLCLSSSEVLRGLGGRILDAPESISTVFDPAVQETDANFGVIAALSEFDAQLNAGAFFENNDRPLNNLFEGGGTRLFSQDLNQYNLALSKKSGIGTNLTLRNATEYDFNNAPGNSTPNLPWENRLEFEIRQPLLQGAGIIPNQIAGANGTTGVYRGVLIARIRNDISLAEFEQAVHRIISQIETAYWELYFAYRKYDAAVEARDRANFTWVEVKALADTGRRGGERARLAQAEEQFFRLDSAVEDSLWGRAVEETDTDLFHGQGGILSSERRLRRIMGLTASDGRLLRPSDQPPLANILFDWDHAVAEALERRVELRRQRWIVKQRELEQLAARHSTLPRLDAVGGYRFRGLGENLFSGNNPTGSQFESALDSLTSGDFQEWQLGIDFSVPIGNRRAFAAVRNAELKLARERAILREQERTVVAQLADAVAEKERAFHLTQKNFNRTKAAREQLTALEIDFSESDGAERARLLDLLLNAQILAGDAETNFHRSLSEYMVAIKNVHLQKGSLLSVNQVGLSEGNWPTRAQVPSNH